MLTFILLYTLCETRIQMSCCLINNKRGGLAFPYMAYVNRCVVQFGPVRIL